MKLHKLEPSNRTKLMRQLDESSKCCHSPCCIAKLSSFVETKLGMCLNKISWTPKQILMAV